MHQKQLIEREDVLEDPARHLLASKASWLPAAASTGPPPPAYELAAALQTDTRPETMSPPSSASDTAASCIQPPPQLRLYSRMLVPHPLSLPALLLPELLLQSATASRGGRPPAT